MYKKVSTIPITEEGKSENGTPKEQHVELRTGRHATLRNRRIEGLISKRDVGGRNINLSRAPTSLSHVN